MSEDNNFIIEENQDEFTIDSKKSLKLSKQMSSIGDSMIKEIKELITQLENYYDYFYVTGYIPGETKNDPNNVKLNKEYKKAETLFECPPKVNYCTYDIIIWLVRDLKVHLI